MEFQSLLTIKEVLQIFKVSRRTVYNWIDKKILTPVKISGSLRFRSEDVRALIEDDFAPQTRKPKILAIDDDVLVRLSLKQLLEKQGYAAHTVASGAEALELLRKEPFDLVITDFRMPDMNGIETISEMKKIRAAIPQIVLTAYADASLEERAKALGVRHIVAKPFDLNEFSKIIQTNLN